MIEITQLAIYPVKSCRGIDQEKLEFDALGPKYDRRWMVVRPSGEFITQRTQHRLGLIQPHLERDELVLEAPGQGHIRVTQQPEPEPDYLDVRVWDFQGKAVDEGEAVARWLSTVLEEPCRLVRFATGVKRSVAEPGAPTSSVGFADAYPLLLLAEASLGDLTERVGEPLSWRRFRPNLVISGAAAYAEDGWQILHGSSISLHVVKPCQRCSIPNLDPETLRRGKEPLRTLSRYRRGEHGVVFGQNCIAVGHGSLSLGQRLRPETALARGQ